MKTGTKQFLRIMNIICWILFLSLCIKTGSILYSFFVSLAINPIAAKNLNMGLNLSDLFEFSKEHYITVASMIIIITGLKAFLFYLVIKIFLKINFVHPFSTEVSVLISKLSYVALGIGVLIWALNKYCEWLGAKAVAFPNSQVYLGGGGEFLLLSAVIFMIAQIFKRGIEIQSENELTV